MVYKLFVIKGDRGYVAVYPELEYTLGTAGMYDLAVQRANKQAKKYLERVEEFPPEQDIRDILDSFDDLELLEKDVGIIKENIVGYSGIYFKS